MCLKPGWVWIWVLFWPSNAPGAPYALTPAGTVHAWGRHASGRLGLPGWLSSSVDAPLPLPARAFGGRPVRTIAAGWRHALAVQKDVLRAVKIHEINNAR